MCPFIPLAQFLFTNVTPILPILYTLSYNDLPVIFSIFIGINLMIFGIEYLVIHIFPSPEGTAFIRNERNEILRTVVIIASFFGVAYILSMISYGILTMSNTPLIGSITSNPSIVNSFNSHWYDAHIRLAFYSVKSIVTTLRGIYLNFFTFEFVIGFLSTISVPVTPSIPMGITIMSFSVMPFEGLTLIATAHTSIVDMITYLISFVYGKLYVLFFSWKAVPFLLMPLGILLRSIYITRKTGSTIIAISLVLYFILPLAVLFSDYLIYDVYKPRVYLISLPHLGAIEGSTMGPNNKLDVLSNVLKKKNAKANMENKKLVAEINSKVEEQNNNWLENLLKKIPVVGNLFISAGGAIKATFMGMISMGKSLWHTFVFMWQLMGDKSTARMMLDMTTPLFYGDVVYPYLINEVVEMSQYAALILFTTVLEIIISVSAYTNLSEFIGGESKILGLSKIV